MITIDRNININEARAAGPYLVHHEGESGGGFYDIALEPQFSRWPEIGHAAIIELKYLKKAGRKPTKAELAAIKDDAVRELDRYASDPALAAKWRLKPVESPKSKVQSPKSKVERPTTGLSTLRPFNFSTFQPFNRRSLRLRHPPPPRPRLPRRRLHPERGSLAAWRQSR